MFTDIIGNNGYMGCFLLGCQHADILKSSQMKGVIHLYVYAEERNKLAMVICQYNLVQRHNGHFMSAEVDEKFACNVHTSGSYTDIIIQLIINHINHIEITHILKIWLDSDISRMEVWCNDNQKVNRNQIQTVKNKYN